MSLFKNDFTGSCSVFVDINQRLVLKVITNHLKKTDINVFFGGPDSITRKKNMVPQARISAI